MRYSLKTDTGKVRNINQDNCDVISLDKDSFLALVCDGMGGSKAGEVASAMAVEIIKERISVGWRSNINSVSILNLLTTAITAANICIFDKSQENVSFNGMGTTLVAVIIHDNKCYIAHVGDSRVYRYRDKLRALTKDHSLVQDMLDAGEITEEQARTHPQKHFITRALGVEEEVEIDFAEHSLIENDVLLLCSDGLYNYINENDISEIINNNPSENVAEILVDLANDNGGGDNISAIVIAVE